MQSNGFRYSDDDALGPPPPLNFGFPSPGATTFSSPLGALDSPTLPASTYGSSMPSPQPPPESPMDDYRPYRPGGGDAARSSKPPGSHSPDLNDPVSMHLLVETALGDSTAYNILSFDDLEALKKERGVLTSRMDALGQKLALETKLRDAAQSINRLYSAKKRRGSSGQFEKMHRRSFSRSSGGSSGSIQVPDGAAKSETELAASSKKCEDLSRELLQVERRFRHVETQLLMHTAGVLQLTHKGPSKRSQSRQSTLMDSISQAARPDSPASIYNYENGVPRTPPHKQDRFHFDERSLYRSPDNLDNLVDALRHGKGLTAKSDPISSGDMEVHNGTLVSVENRLEDLNDRLRQLIIQANPDSNREYDAAPKATSKNNPAERAANIEQKLDFLDQGLRDIEAEQSSMQQMHHNTRHDQGSIEGRLEGINNQLYHMVGSGRTEEQEDYPPPPPPPKMSGHGAQELFDYMEEILYAIEENQQRLVSSLSNFQYQGQQQGQASEYETVLTGLWSIIVSGEEDARQRKLARRRMLEAEGPDGNSDLDEMSPDEEPLSEEFSLSAFSAKVQSIYMRASSMKEKQGILRRQIKQQRELNNKSDAEKEQEFMQLRAEIDRGREELAAARDALHSSTHDGDALEHEEYSRRAAENRVEELEAHLADVQDDARIAAAEASAQLQEAESRMAMLNEALQTAQNGRDDAERAIQEKEEAVERAEEEMRQLESEVVRLQTEVTVARAELDGAYGTRAQRAAEVAANPEIKKELDELSRRNVDLENTLRDLELRAQEAGDREQHLRTELGDTIREFEDLTRASVESEKEREGLEGLIDGLREKMETLEAQLSDERVRWLGMRSPNGPNGAQETTTTMVLRQEFKKMMRETRAEGIKALRAEQEERRKLESLVRSLKREQVPSKSSLSRSMTAA